LAEGYYLQWFCLLRADPEIPSCDEALKISDDYWTEIAFSRANWETIHQVKPAFICDDYELCDDYMTRRSI